MHGGDKAVSGGGTARPQSAVVWEDIFVDAMRFPCGKLSDSHLLGSNDGSSAIFKTRIFGNYLLSQLCAFLSVCVSSPRPLSHLV